MKMMKKRVLCLSLAGMLLMGMAACGQSTQETAEAVNTETVSSGDETTADVIETADDLPGKRIGVQLGTTGDMLVSDYESDGSGTVIERYNKGADAVQALKQGKIDCVVIDEQPAIEFVKQNAGLTILDEELTMEEYAFVLAKENEELLAEVNQALAELKSEGVLDDIMKNYVGTDEQLGQFPYEPADISRENGTLTIATNAEFPPYEYYEEGAVIGIDIDIMQAVCDKLGMELQIEDMAFDSIISAVSTGKVDIGASGFTVTEERKKNINFSDTYAISKQVIIVAGETKQAVVESVDDLSGASIGVQLGTTGDIYVSDYEGDGSGTVVERYNKGADAVQALKQGKIDCVVIDEQPALKFVEQNSGLRILDEEFTLEEYAFAIAKGNEELLTQVNEALEELQEEGVLDSIKKNYVGAEDEVGKYPYEPADAEHPNGTMVVATNAEFPPYEYYENGEITGMDMDIMRAVCDKLGMDMQIEDMAFDAIISAVSTGKADIGAAGFTVTEERQKNVNFSDTYTTSKQVVIVADASVASEEASFAEKFHDNFIKEDRYMYLLKGLGNTLVITIFAVVIGIVLGFLIAIIRTNHDRNGGLTILNAICKAYLTIVRGTPVMIQLLIIYYVIFQSINAGKMVVAIIAFGLNSAAYVAEIVRSGIMAVDVGQFEAGRSLGLNYQQTMANIIMPQAIKNILPALCNEFISLLKETSISGYIGLMDLTKGGDIVRSVTYEAFMPLIAVAIIYLILVMGMSKIVNILERKLRNNER